MDAILRDDAAKVDEIWEDMQSVPPMIPRSEQTHFAEYNTQAEKARTNASGYANVGRPRAPYRDLPELWQAHAEAAGKGWAALCERYRSAERSPSP